MSLLVEWIERGSPASRSRSRAPVAASRGVGRQAPEHRADALAVRVARAQRPVLVKAGQQLTAAQVQRIERPSLGREPLETRASRRSPPRPARCARGSAATASVPIAERSADRAVRRLVRALSSSTFGHSRRGDRRPCVECPGAARASRAATSPGGARAAPARPRRAPAKAPRGRTREASRGEPNRRRDRVTTQSRCGHGDRPISVRRARIGGSIDDDTHHRRSEARRVHGAGSR